MGKTEIVKILLEKGANPDLQGKNGYTALMVASMNGHTDIVTELLNKSANPDLKNAEGKTALDLASNSDIMSLLANTKKPE
jgi:serine/threonine-protein phosphatase 6 regulatory ankyrin repeat subunit B